MIAVLDTNTIWRRELFRALGTWRPVLGVRPCDWCASLTLEPGPAAPGYADQVVVLPFGWASRTAGPSQAWLWRRVRAASSKIDGVVVTSPHYLPLVKRLSSAYPVFYYCSDDYRLYTGWDAERMRNLECQVVAQSAHSWFVSEPLAQRARVEYCVPPDQVSVSMNATAPDFFPDDVVSEPSKLPEALIRPVVGVTGAINERLDFDLLIATAALPEVGTLLLVGGLPAQPEPALRLLLGHPRVRAVGPQPHSSMSRWTCGLDVALMPYRRTPFNAASSPMRLFAHLASGRPIVATDACTQVALFADVIDVTSSAETFLQRVRSCLVDPFDRARQEAQLARARAHTWAARATEIARCLEPLVQRPPCSPAPPLPGADRSPLSG